jgi:hypothetical protein
MAEPFQPLQAPHDHAELPGSHASILGICVHVDRAAGVRQGCNLAPPRVDFSARLHRDDRLGQTAPPSAGFLNCTPQPVLAAGSDKVDRTGRQDDSLHRGRPYIITAVHMQRSLQGRWRPDWGARHRVLTEFTERS